MLGPIDSSYYTGKIRQLRPRLVPCFTTHVTNVASMQHLLMTVDSKMLAIPEKNCEYTHCFTTMLVVSSNSSLVLLSFMPVSDKRRVRDEIAVDAVKSVGPLVLVHGVLAPPPNPNGLLDPTSESVTLSLSITGESSQINESLQIVSTIEYL